MFSNKKDSETCTVSCRQMGRWQLDAKTERSLRYLMAKATWRCIYKLYEYEAFYCSYSDSISNVQNFDDHIS